MRKIVAVAIVSALAGATLVFAGFQFTSDDTSPSCDYWTKFSDHVPVSLSTQAATIGFINQDTLDWSGKILANQRAACN